MKNIKNKRLELLKELKSSIRGSAIHMPVGVDIAKDSHVAFMGQSNGHTLLKTFSFPNNIVGFEKFINKVETVKEKNGLEKVVIGLEPTANYHKPLGEFLINRSYETVLVSNIAVKKNRGLIDGRWDKNDKKDAANIADLISQGKCLYYEDPVQIHLEVRNLLSYKRKLKKQLHSVQMRIKGHLVTQFFPELDKYFNLIKEECFAIVKHCFDPKQIAQLSYNEFFKLVTKRPKSIKQKQRLMSVWEEAKTSIGCHFTQATEFEATTLVNSYNTLKKTISEADKKIEQLCKQLPEYKYLISIPGFGPIISGMTIGAIGDPFRFNSGKQVLKLAGYDLSASISGKNSKYAIKCISKKGKSEFRYALFQAAKIASSSRCILYPYLLDKIKNREKEKGIKTKIRVKLAAKLLIIAWTLMKEKKLFDINQFYV